VGDGIDNYSTSTRPIGLAIVSKNVLNDPSVLLGRMECQPLPRYKEVDEE